MVRHSRNTLDGQHASDGFRAGTDCAGALRAAAAIIACALTLHAQVPGRNVNMVSGTSLYDGDPFLQRQNEPSIAVSTRNPLHLLAGANDYRTVDIRGIADSGLKEQNGDAWVGVYKSFDGGQSWRSTLLPGYPQDTTALGAASPLKAAGYRAGADVVVRAGTNGLFFMAGLGFDRGEDPPSGIFVATFIDNNNNETGDTIHYQGTRIVAQSSGGSGGKFLDKPWLAVDFPRAGAMTCSIASQTFQGGNVYLAYAEFAEEESVSRIMFSRSRDCGQSWSAPIALSPATADGKLSNRDQGASIGIDPANGAVYVVWRRAPKGSKDLEQSDSGANAGATTQSYADSGNSIMVAKSVDGGATFTTATEVAAITPLDQDSTETAFRSVTYPTITVDATNRVYVAWSESGLGLNGEARVVITTSTDGAIWTPRTLVEPAPSPVSQLGGFYGHQFMPSLTYGGGKVMLVFYDTRLSHTVGHVLCKTCPGNPLARNEVDLAGDLLPPVTAYKIATVFNRFVSDRNLLVANRLLDRRQTVDVRAGIADPGAAPNFKFTIVSEYPFGSRSEGSNAKPIEQLRFDPPNLPLFAQGSRAFIGDYIDVSPAPPLVLINVGTRYIWRVNTTEPPSYHVAWTDNRDVRPPLDGDWSHYTPPAPAGPSVFDPSQNRPECSPDSTGMRNQNIYTANVTAGLIAGSPGNNKPLGVFERAFVVFVKNTTDQLKTFRLTIPASAQPSGGRASFTQSGTVAGREIVSSIDVQVAPRSSISRAVFVTAHDARALVPVQAVEVAGVKGAPVPNTRQATVLLNPDLTTPDLMNPDLMNPDLMNPDIRNAELYNPDLMNPDLMNPDLMNPVLTDADLTNPDLMNPDLMNPDLMNPDLMNPDLMNPDLTNPGIPNPDLMNPDLMNPDLMNPDLMNLDLVNVSMADGTWRLTNQGNTTASYRLGLLLRNVQTASPFRSQLLVYRVYKTPDAKGCQLIERPHVILLDNIVNPQFGVAGPNGYPDLTDALATNSDLANATVSVRPGEIVYIRLRVVGPDRQSVRNFIQNSVILTATPHAVNTVDIAAGLGRPRGVASRPLVASTSLADGVAGRPYRDVLLAYTPSVTEPRTWSITSGRLPAGLNLNAATGQIDGTTSETGLFAFTVRVAVGSQSDTRALSIRIANPLAITTPSLPTAVINVPYSANLSATGGVPDIGWRLASGSNALPAGLTLSTTGAITGVARTEASSTFSVEAIDKANPAQTTTRQYTIRVAAMSIDNATLPDAVTGRSYSAALIVTGGTAPYAWTVASGSLPSPITLDRGTGRLSGTPTTAGTYNFDVQVSDSTSHSARKPFSIRVADPLGITVPTLGPPIQSRPYSAQLAATGGIGPIAWTVSNGVLPSGLTLDAATGQIKGTPTALETRSFEVRATDSSNPALTATVQLSLAVTSPAQPIRLELVNSSRVGVGRDAVIRATLPSPATNPVDVTLATDNAAVLSIANPKGTVPAGSSTVDITVHGVKEGTANITATAPGYRDGGPLAVLVTLNLISVAANLNVPLAHTTDMPITLAPNPAPAGGLVVNVTSSAPGVVEVVTPTVTIPAGQFSANATLRGASLGPAQVTASNASYASGATAATTTAQVNILESSVTFYSGFERSATVQVESAGNAIAAPAGGFTINVSAAQSGCLSVPATVTIPPGNVTASIPLTYGGTASRPCTTALKAEAPLMSSDSINVTVNGPPTITFNGVNQVGANLQVSTAAGLTIDNHGGVAVTIRSTNPAVLLLSPDANTPGASQIVVNVQNLTTGVPFFVQGVALGTSTINFSAPKFADASATITVVPAGIRLNGVPRNMTTLDPDRAIFADVGPLPAGATSLATIQQLRAGSAPIPVRFDSSAPSVATLVSSSGTGTPQTVFLQPGTGNTPTPPSAGSVSLRPVGAGTTVLSVSAPGFTSTPTNNPTVSVTVTTPLITVSSIKVGAGLQRGHGFALESPNHGGVDVVVTTSNPSVALVSADPNTVGTTSITIHVPNGQNSGIFYTQGTSLGSSTITAAAPKFADGSGAVTVVQPGIRIDGVPTTTTTLSADSLIGASVGVPAAAGSTVLSELQAVRAGALPLPVTFKSSPSGVATLRSGGASSDTQTISISPGLFSTATGAMSLHPVGAGVSTISTSSPGFADASASKSVTITAPGLPVSPGTIGTGLQAGFAFDLGAANHGGVTVRLSSSNPTIALITADPAVPGAAFIDVPVANGNTRVTYYVQALANGTTTIGASAPRFAAGSAVYTVEKPSLGLVGPPSPVQAVGPDIPFSVIIGTAPNGGALQCQSVRAGSAPLPITFDSSVSTVARLTTSTASGSPVTAFIQPGQCQTAPTVAGGGVALDPLTSGQMIITATAPGTTSDSKPVTVVTPTLSMGAVPVGSGLENSSTFGLSTGSHGGVTVHLESSNPAIALVSRDATTPGAASIDVFVPNGNPSAPYYVQGLENVTGTVVVTATAPGFISATGTVNVVAPAVLLGGVPATISSTAANVNITASIGIPAGGATLQQFQNVRPGGQPVTVTFTNSNAAAARLTTTAGSAQSVTAVIPVLQSVTPTGAVQFDPLAAGTTTVSVTVPGGTPINTGSRTVTITP